LALVLSVAVAAVGLLFWQSAKGSGRSPSSASLPPEPGQLGPEGVPIPAAPRLARANAPAPRDVVDGISAAPLEQLAFHIHAHLTVFVDRAPRLIPYGVGIAPPLEVDPTVRGPFALGGTAFFWLHTHASDGIIPARHTASCAPADPTRRRQTVGRT
jgi:hypothetical protein